MPEIFTATKSLRDSFGVLSFGDEPTYYALDGQHRVAAIKLLVNRETDAKVPPGFDDDLLSVIVVLREEHDVPEGEWMRRYRRLFSSLNRWAKKTDRDTDIIMDEDDLFAILTRRLITDHEFFQAPGRERDSFRVQTEKKNLKSNASHFTSLQTLYEINKQLLTTRERGIRGWLPSGEDIDIQIRPDEGYIDDCYEELSAYWDAILEALSVLREAPEKMRRHNLGMPEDGEYRDHLLFWPIGQELFAGLVRSLLDDVFPAGGRGDVAEMVTALRPLEQIPWDLHKAPWRYLLLVPANPPQEDSWRMRSEDRKSALKIAGELLRWIVGLDPRDDEDTKTLCTDWQKLLYPEPPSESRVEEMWQEIVEVRARIVTSDGIE